jgi:alkanesulfonate monooxygenase SsuD/methylene tetrahydromethanopterin reductase-like flavin-dependent oxidoreductase (luciferase family)
MLTIGLRHAHIVGLTGFRMVMDVPVAEWFGAAAIARRLALVRGAAGDRAEALELNALIQNVIITKDRRAAARKVVDEWGMAGFDIDVALDTPFMLFGSVQDVADQLRRYREELGLTFFAVGSMAGPGFDAVVEELAGT